MSEGRGLAAAGGTPPEVATGWAANTAELHEWAEGEGTSFVYARAARVPRAIGDAALRLYTLGIITMVHRKITGGWAFTALRVAGRRYVAPPPRATLATRTAPAGRPRPVPIGEKDELLTDLLKILRIKASGGKPCPTNETLAAQLGLRNPDAASYLLRRLRDMRHILIEVPADPSKPRVVTIVATGKSTRAG